MVLYDFDSNLIWATAIPSKTKLQLFTAYKQIFYLIQRWGIQPQLQRLDNECYNLLKEFMTANDMALQLTPKVKHPHNYSEKSIQTWKYYFLSGMVSTDLEFTFSQWCKLVEQGKIILNLLRPYRLNPKLSVYAQVFGAFYYQKNSIATTWHESTGPCPSHRPSIVWPACNQGFLCMPCNGTLPLL